MSKRKSATNGLAKAHDSQTHRKLVRLRELASGARQNIYERCKLASEILADRDWIAIEHGGEYDAAQKALEDDFFSDVAGFIVLADLVLIYKQFPDEAQWKELRYNLAALKGAMREATREPKPAKEPQKRATLAQLAELEEQLASATQRAENLSRTISNQAEEITALKDEVARLKKENAELRRQAAPKTDRQLAMAGG
jgi:DNA repair exonuclease SbcCD ATPase subunit